MLHIVLDFFADQFFELDHDEGGDSNDESDNSVSSPLFELSFSLIVCF